MSETPYVKTALFPIVLFFTALSLYCGSNLNDEDKILKLYSDLTIEYSKENLRGIMKPVSKDFKSDIYNMSNYDDFMYSNAALLKMNRNISVDIRNIEITINENNAEVVYKLHFISDQNEFMWKQKDYLIKSRGGWKIISKEELD
ncbi:hypothetical protein ACFL4T_12700 [candidate division KSB1 bacterium]